MTGVGKSLFCLLSTAVRCFKYGNSSVKGGVVSFKIHSKSYCLGQDIYFIVEQWKSSQEMTHYYQNYLYVSVAKNAMWIQVFFKEPLSVVLVVCFNFATVPSNVKFWLEFL